MQWSGYNTWPRLTMVATSENQHTDHLTVQTATNENKLNTYVYHAPHHHKKTTEGGIILPKGSGYYRIGGNVEAKIQATTELAGISKRKQYYEYIHIYMYIYIYVGDLRHILFHIYLGSDNSNRSNTDIAKVLGCTASQILPHGPFSLSSKCVEKYNGLPK